jgi:predicted transcriptional regulator
MNKFRYTQELQELWQSLRPMAVLWLHHLLQECYYPSAQITEDSLIRMAAMCIVAGIDFTSGRITDETTSQALRNLLKRMTSTGRLIKWQNH